MTKIKLFLSFSIFSLFCCFYLMIAQREGISQVTGKLKGWELKGDEILLELCGENAKFPHGIYALDPFAPNPKPRLLAKGWRRPVWSPKRRFVACLRNYTLWIIDRKGNFTEIWDSYLSNLGFHDPPVVWTWKEGFFVVWRISSWGGTVIHQADEAPKEGEEWHPFVPLIIMPLKRRLPEEPLPRRGNIKWDDLLCFNNPTASPDGRYVAAEVYPSGPEDLRRAESKILIYERCPPEEMELWWQWEGQTFKGKGRRLTNLGEDVTELRPLWSPTGEWIAFTVVHWKDGYVAPAVIRPDGNDYIELLSKYAHYAISLGQKWEPIVPLDKDNPLRFNIYNIPKWGRPNVYPVEWSEDGRFLLLNMGRRYENLQVAKWDGKEWWVAGIGGHMTSGFGGLKFAAFGVGRWLAAVFDRDLIWVVEVNPDDIQKSQRKMISMPEGVWIEWMDW
ncbi:MAG: hypothetical protein RUDDFDWM_002043 [Candidatus Fervidibacterota bacterium]